MSRPSSSVHLIFFTTVLLLGIGMRTWNLDALSVWTDEQDSLMQSRHLAEIWPNRGNGTLYFTVLNFWRAVFGDSVFAIRSLSAIFGIVSIILVGKISFLVSGRQSDAVLSMFICSILPLLVWHSRDARMYPMWGVGFLVALWGLVLFENRFPTPAAWLLYTLGNIGALLSHNYHGFYILGFAVAAAAIRAEPSVYQRFRNWLLFHLPIIVLSLIFLARLFFMKEDLLAYLKEHSHAPWSFDLAAAFQKAFLYRNPAASFFGDSKEGWLIVCGFVGLSLWAFQAYRHKGLAYSMVSLFWIPSIFIQLLPVRDNARLFFPVVIQGAILAGALCSAEKRVDKSRRFFLTGIRIFAALSVAIYLSPNIAYAFKDSMEPWLALCSELKGNTAVWPHTILLLESGHPESPMAQCDLPSDNLLKVDGSLSFKVLKHIGENDVVVVRSPPWVVENSVLRFLDESSSHRRQRREFGPYLDVRYYYFERPRLSK